MYHNEKKLNIFVGKFHKHLRTHLAKDIVYSKSFQNGGRLNFNLKLQENIYHSKIVLVISKRSKMDLSDANAVIGRLLQVRTYDDLDIKAQKIAKGIRITFKIEDKIYLYDIIIFKSFMHSNQLLSSYTVHSGIHYYWHQIIDYIKHPGLITEKCSGIFHRLLTEMLQMDKDIKIETNWTKLILERRALNG